MENNNVKVTVIKVGENLDFVEIGATIKFKKDYHSDFKNKIIATDEAGTDLGVIAPTRTSCAIGTVESSEIFDSVPDEFSGAVIDNTKRWTVPSDDTYTSLVVELGMLEDTKKADETAEELEDIVFMVAQDSYAQKHNIKEGAKLIFKVNSDPFSFGGFFAYFENDKIGHTVSKCNPYLLPNATPIEDVYDKLPGQFVGTVISASLQYTWKTGETMPLFFVRVDKNVALETAKVAVITTDMNFFCGAGATLFEGNALTFEKASNVINCLTKSDCIGYLYPDLNVDGVSRYDEIIDRVDDKFEGTIVEIKDYDHIIVVIAEIVLNSEKENTEAIEPETSASQETIQQESTKQETVKPEPVQKKKESAQRRKIAPSRKITVKKELLKILNRIKK